MMRKNIYQLLNEVETDFREYEQTELSSREKDYHKQKVLMEVRRMENKVKKNRKVWKVAAGVAAACAVTVGAASIANPVLAEELFSSVFGNLVENAQGEKYEQEDTERYTKIGKSSTSVEDEVAKQPEQGSYVTTMENNGVTVSVSDVYCDGYVLYYTATVKTDNEGLNKADGMVVETKEGQSPTISVDGAQLSGYASKAFEKSKDGSFVTINQIDLIAPTDAQEKPMDLKVGEKDTMVVDWEVKQFVGYLWDQWDESGEYASTGKVEGDWHLRFPVTIDKSGNESFDINKEENGIMVKSAVKTKAGLVVEVELPDFTRAPYNDPYNDPDMGIKDSEGNWLQWMNQKADMHEDGTSTMQIMVLYDGEKDLTFEVVSKDEEPVTFASIGFQVP